MKTLCYKSCKAEKESDDRVSCTNSVRLGNYHDFFLCLKEWEKSCQIWGLENYADGTHWDMKKKARTKNSVLVYNSLVYNGYILRQIRGTD